MADSDKRPAAGGSPEQAPEPAAERPAMSAETASLLGLIDKLSTLLERSELVELEVEAGQTGIVLRKPSALAPIVVEAPAAAAPTAGETGPVVEAAVPSPTARVVRAPLTGIFYSAPSPAAPPYVTVGQHITTGQVIGLIEAMKLFNEIKSDATGRVLRIVAESGKLVKTKQPLIEVEP